VTYSIFDTSGNLVDAFVARDAALDYLARRMQSEPASVDDLFLVAQDVDGNVVGEAVDGSFASGSA